MSPSVSPLSPVCFIYLNDSSTSTWSLSRQLGNFPYMAFSFHLSPHHLLEVFLVLELQLFGLPSGFLAMIIGHVICCSSLCQVFLSFLEYRVKSLGVLVSEDSLFVMYVCSPIIVALYSFSRFMSDLPHSWHGRYILCTSAFLASIWFICSCFLVILSRFCILSSFQSMTP